MADIMSSSGPAGSGLPAHIQSLRYNPPLHPVHFCSFRDSFPFFRFSFINLPDRYLPAKHGFLFLRTHLFNNPGEKQFIDFMEVGFPSENESNYVAHTIYFGWVIELNRCPFFGFPLVALGRGRHGTRVNQP